MSFLYSVSVIPLVNNKKKENITSKAY